MGTPTAESPVFASANYTLSFYALRSAIAGVDAYILVLDTKGINVWCAAGKGAFGTDELVNWIDTAGLAGIVTHRKIILPQLGAPGISAHDVQRRSGFKVAYGPVRARDLPEYLRRGNTTPEMRRVEFPVRDRIVLAPVELVHVALPAIVVAAVLWFLAGPAAGLAAISAVVAGTVLFPVLLPFIPTQDFSTKGLLLGGVVAIPFAMAFASAPTLPGLAVTAGAVTPLLIMPAVTAYIALNFTGATTFTSRTGVRKEIFRYVPVITIMAGAGVVLGIVLGVSRLLGVI
ncbi:MAG: mercury methylation corrinoid protein HgcA [Methanoregula sp.]